MGKYNFNDLYNRFYAETSKIIGCFETPLPNERKFYLSCREAHIYCREMCVIRLQDAWARFCRNLIISSAGFRPVTLSGVVVPLAPGIKHVSDVIPTLLSTYPKPKPSGWEPRWHIVNQSIDAANRLRIYNYADVSSGLGSTPSPIEDINFIRNYLAHRQYKTALNLVNIKKSLRISINSKIDDIINYTIFPGISLFVKWINELRNIALISIS